MSQVNAKSGNVRVHPGEHGVAVEFYTAEGAMRFELPCADAQNVAEQLMYAAQKLALGQVACAEDAFEPRRWIVGVVA